MLPIFASSDFCPHFFLRHADDTSGLTWGGQSYETDDARAKGSISTETVPTSAGLDISDTEAVLLTFIRSTPKHKRFPLEF